jgi:hypothetical protein
MGLFVERMPSAGALENVITQGLRANPGDAEDPKKVALHVAAATQAKDGTYVYKWARILVALLIGGVLLAVGIALAIYSDNWTADQAVKAATTSGYIAAKSSLAAIATSFIGLGSAWSGGVLGAVLNSTSSS